MGGIVPGLTGGSQTARGARPRIDKQIQASSQPLMDILMQRLLSGPKIPEFQQTAPMSSFENVALGRLSDLAINAPTERFRPTTGTQALGGADLRKVLSGG